MSVDSGGVAEKSGLEAGDILYRFDDLPLPLPYPMAWLRKQVVPLKIAGGKSRIVRIFRWGAELDVEVTWPHP